MKEGGRGRERGREGGRERGRERGRGRGREGVRERELGREGGSTCMYLVEVVVIRWRRYSSRVEEEPTRNM